MTTLTDLSQLTKSMVNKPLDCRENLNTASDTANRCF